MRQDVVELLKSSSPVQRMRGWRELHTDCVERHYELTPADREFLTERLQNEEGEDDGVWRFGMTVCVQLAFGALSAPASASPVLPSPPLYLHQWLWDPFHASSALVGTAKGAHVRDAMALLALARRLSDEQFPHTEMVLVPLCDPQWEEVLYQRKFAAICLVGRLGLFGKEALRRWNCGEAHFGFILHERPEGCAPPALHPDYQSLSEK